MSNIYDFYYNEVWGKMVDAQSVQCCKSRDIKLIFTNKKKSILLRTNKKYIIENLNK